MNRTSTSHSQGTQFADCGPTLLLVEGVRSARADARLCTLISANPLRHPVLNNELCQCWSLSGSGSASSISGPFFESFYDLGLKKRWSVSRIAGQANIYQAFKKKTDQVL